MFLPGFVVEALRKHEIRQKEERVAAATRENSWQLVFTTDWHSQISLTANTYTHLYESRKRATADRMDTWFRTTSTTA